MSIYVDLLDKVEKRTAEAPGERAGQKPGSSKFRPSDYDFLFEEEQRVSVELPNIDDCWDEILAGKASRPTGGKTGKASLTKSDSDVIEQSGGDALTDPESDTGEEVGVHGAEQANDGGSEYRIKDYGDADLSDRVVRRPAGHAGDVPEETSEADETARHPSDEAEISSESGILELPLAKFRRAGMVTPDMEHKGIVEEYRHLKRMLLRNIAKSEGKMGTGVAITSALPGEGKSFTALNLAMSFSLEKNRTVLLVDADIEKGGVTRFLGLDGRPGLRDYLENPDLTVEDLVVKTSEPNICILPIGRGHAPVAELFSSERMEGFVATVSSSEKYQMVIFDSPPVLVSSAANTLSGYADQTLVVVQANQTSAHMIHEVEEALVDSRKIGFLLNRMAFSEKKHNIYYYSEND